MTKQSGQWIVCKVCAARFYVKPSRVATAKYCNYKCHQVGEGRKGGRVRAAQMKAKARTRRGIV